MHPLWQWLITPSNHDLLVAIVGAAIGGIIGFLGSIVGVIGAYWLTARSERKKDGKRFFSLLKILLAEIEYTADTIQEIKKDVIDAHGKSTKRMNSDVFESLRFGMAEFMDNKSLLQLTKNYRNIVHTNDMLDRLEKESNAPQIEQFRQMTAASLESTSEGIKELMDTIGAKLKQSTRAPRQPPPS